MAKLGRGGEDGLGGAVLGASELVPGQLRLSVGQEEEAIDENFLDDVDVDVDVGFRRRHAQRQLLFGDLARLVELKELDFPDFKSFNYSKLRLIL